MTGETKFERGVKTLLEMEAGHSLFDCQKCGNDSRRRETRKKCSFAKIREARESKMEVFCQQEIKRTSSCRNLHIENECLQFPGQYCWNKCWSNCCCWKCNPENPKSTTHSSSEICPKHQQELDKNKGGSSGSP